MYCGDCVVRKDTGQFGNRTFRLLWANRYLLVQKQPAVRVGMGSSNTFRIHPTATASVKQRIPLQSTKDVLLRTPSGSESRFLMCGQHGILL